MARAVAIEGVRTPSFASAAERTPEITSELGKRSNFYNFGGVMGLEHLPKRDR
jgi:hypothetical protein